ncbi:MAG: hypothetical protein HXY50_01185 [Ignavibacteriaceae bacterium]|nr:hypothetical protein [Ignavibacteriaceae bacterium]
MKKIILSLFFALQLLGQAEYVSIENPVYSFLQRMDNLGYLAHYNQFENPKSRGEIAHFLNQVILGGYALDKADQEVLEDLKIEFEYELFGTIKNTNSVFGSSNYDILSNNEKYLFAFSEKSKMNLFINLLAESELIIGQKSSNETNSALLLNAGGEIRGTISNFLGFYLNGTNGIAHGNKSTALAKKKLQYNFKFNEKVDEHFFDETQAYVTADFNEVKLKLGRDRLNIGYGVQKLLLGNSSPLYDYLSLKINYDFFNFSYIHGKLLGEGKIIPDSIYGESKSIVEKYFVYHRMGFDVARYFKFGVSEIVIYGDRPIDLSYLIPFSFFKSIEHSNQDRDNSMLIFDFSSNLFKSTNVFSTFLIDDISFGKIGTGWWGNQTAFNIGFHSSPFYPHHPLDIKFEYLHLEPYTLSHRFTKNNFTHFGYNLGSNLQPNSELFFLEISYRFTNRVTLSASFAYSNHGANVINDDGTIKNVGGDIKLGRRLFDSERVKFLDGDLEIQKNIAARLTYEPINQYTLFIDAQFNYINANKRDEQESIFLFAGANIKL